jgi:hypothetical protein
MRIRKFIKESTELAGEVVKASAEQKSTRLGWALKDNARREWLRKRNIGSPSSAIPARKLSALDPGNLRRGPGLGHSHSSGQRQPPTDRGSPISRPKIPRVAA